MSDNLVPNSHNPTSQEISSEPNDLNPATSISNNSLEISPVLPVPISALPPMNSNTMQVPPASDIAVTTGAIQQPLNEDPVMIEVQYEMFSNLQNRPNVLSSMTLSSSLPPSLFRSTIVEAMGLNTNHATLDYNIFGLPGRQIPRVFNTEPQVQDAIRQVRGYIARSRSVKKGLKVSNLDPVIKNPDLDTGNGLCAPKPKAPGKLLKQESAELNKAMRLKKAIIKLRTMLRCQRCRGMLCYVDPTTGKHIRCSHQMIALWAKLSVESPDTVDLSHPPNHHLFDSVQGSDQSDTEDNSADIKPASKLIPNNLSTSCPTVLGSNNANAIFVSNDTPPPLKRTKYQDCLYDSDVIDLCSDSDSDTDVCRIVNPSRCSTPVPGPSTFAYTNCAKPVVTDLNLLDTIAPLLALLDCTFPAHAFFLYYPAFDQAGVHTIKDLATRSAFWVMETTGMDTASAYIVLGAAMSAAGMTEHVPLDRKGKRKADF